MSDELYERGLAARKQVMGDEAVRKSLETADAYARELDKFETEFVWGLVWSRAGLPVKTRCMLTIAMLIALNRPNELRVQLRAALANGCTKEELVEVLLQGNAYCGGPAGVDAFRAAREVFAEAGVPGARP